MRVLSSFKKILPLFIFLGFVFYFQSEGFRADSSNFQHEWFIDNSPFKNQMTLTKSERNSMGLPPNKYAERQWELTMNPKLGYPEYDKLYNLQESLRKSRAIKKSFKTFSVPGDSDTNKWVERGPNNVGGRTRGLLFDPNDTTNETVFAGGVSGGLWKNSNISNPDASWQLLDIPQNLAVSSIVYDPNNSQILYAGTGESYTGGDANGNGLWKSSDGGQSWVQVFGGRANPGTVVVSSGRYLAVSTPVSEQAVYDYSVALFGPSLHDIQTISGTVVLVQDNSETDNDSGGGSFTDACSALTNASELNGKIALIDRGDCYFTEKVKRAQDAGAIAVIIANNVSGDLVSMSGTDSSITIPSIMVSITTANKLKTILATNTLEVQISFKNLSGGVPNIEGAFFVNDVVVRNNGGVSEVYVAIDSGYDSDSQTYLGGETFGLFKSSDSGATWQEIALNSTTYSAVKLAPNDIEIGADNKIWIATTDNSANLGGGTILSSTDGINFNEAYSVPAAKRTEIETSVTNSQTIYVLARQYDDVKKGFYPAILKTEDGFATAPTTLPLPDDKDTGIDADDFTRGQSFYDLMIETDPTNDQIVYVGGIDLFKSVDGGQSWGQISHWYGGFQEQYVHADQHAMQFANSSTMVFGNDGGVYYSATSGAGISARNKGFATSQFYTLAVAPSTMFETGSHTKYGNDLSNLDYVAINLQNDVFAGGAQDNGTLLMSSPSDQSAKGIDIFGGDGAATFFSQNPDKKYVISNYVYNNAIELHNLETDKTVTINNEETAHGDFINPQELDSKLDILYSNYSSGNNIQIMRYGQIYTGPITKDLMSNSLLNRRPTTFAVSPYTSNASTLVVGLENGKVLKIENADKDQASQNWSEIADFDGSISDIEFGSSENNLFVTIYNYGVQSVFYSDNGGQSWQAKEGDLPDIPVRCILQNPLETNEVIVGTDLGVWSTTNFFDASPNWSQSQNGMRDVRVTDLDMRNDFAVFASTYGRGIFSSYFKANTPTLVISTDNNALTLEQGQTGSYSIDFMALEGFNEETTFSITGLPADASASFNPNNPIVIDQNGKITIEINVANTSPLGEYSISVLATSATQSKTLSLTLKVLTNDNDNDGILNSSDNCKNISNPNQEDYDGDGIGDFCDANPLPTDHFTVQQTSETCRNSNNGTISVSMKGNLNYNVSVTSDVTGFSFTTATINGTSWTLENLEAGLYQVCFEVSELNNFIQCFNIIITQPADLSVLSYVNTKNNVVNLQLAGGNMYNINLNGKTQIVSKSNIELALRKGLNTLRITAENECQGVYEEAIFVSEDVLLSPNPTSGPTTLFVGGDDKMVKLHLFDLIGRHIRAFNKTLVGRSAQLDFESLPRGIYLLNVESKHVKQTLKIVKQ